MSVQVTHVRMEVHATMTLIVTLANVSWDLVEKSVKMVSICYEQITLF